MSGFCETILSSYLDEFIEERLNNENYADDLSDAIHKFADETACVMNHQNKMIIIDACGGVFKCLKDYQNEYGEFDFDKSDALCYSTLVYLCIHNYINENYDDPESEAD
jgi:hypothetical protein